MDPLTLAAGVAALAGLTAAWQLRHRALRAETRIARLHAELAAERHAATHDELTGLPNRRAFYQIGARLTADPARQPLIAVVLDLDDFKQINDRFGHAAGDHVLVTVARRFAAYAGDNLVARLGGDEFAGLLTAPTHDGHSLRHATRRLAEALAEPIDVAGEKATVTASVGLAPLRGTTELAEALRDADAAMYHAKNARRPLPHVARAPIAPTVAPRMADSRHASLPPRATNSLAGRVGTTGLRPHPRRPVETTPLVEPAGE